MNKITIIEDDPITGIKYGTIEVPETEIEIKHDSAARTYEKTMQHAARRTRKLISRHEQHK